MTDIRHHMVVTAIVAVTGIGPAAAAQDHPHTVGKNVKLTACVEQAVRPNTFVLTHTADVPIHQPVHGRVIYWLDMDEALQGHVGHQVQLEGAITEVVSQEMEVRQGEDGWVVEVEGPQQDVIATAEQVGVATSDREVGADDVRITLVRVKVERFTMIAEACPVEPRP